MRMGPPVACSEYRGGEESAQFIGAVCGDHGSTEILDAGLVDRTNILGFEMSDDDTLTYGVLYAVQTRTCTSNGIGVDQDAGS